VRIRIDGVIQGVGFRPFVCRLARRMDVSGTVRNVGGAVVIEAAAGPDLLERFVVALGEQAPAAAEVAAIVTTAGDLPASHFTRPFAIVASADSAEAELGVGPDLATCPDCLAEIGDPHDRRFAYAFTNCTNCGPRLSILQGTPYDRAETTMTGFAMCEDCRREYDDPADRRFHAQPNACPACGPRLALRFFDGRPDLDDWTAIRDDTWRLLDAGSTIAIKGIGGYHLACLATDETAVRRLRLRKRRPDKPLAVMAGTLDTLCRHCVVSRAEAALLTSPRAPIVLLRQQRDTRIAYSVAPGQHRIGAMLPYSPLHHLLFEGRSDVLVMTSGNLSDEPQVIDDREARRVFADIADAVLHHDRPIAVRVDDSVLRIDGRRTTHLRLGRGYAPFRLKAPAGLEQGDILALGAQLKSTFCLKHRERLVLSQHVGDLEQAANVDAFAGSLDHYRRLYDISPAAVAVDLHPGLKSRELGQGLAASLGVPLIEVQHHHAHAAACLVEHGRPASSPPVLALVLDGLGYGTDGTFWGCECLAVDYAGFRRLAHLRPVPMPGGAAAIRQPWRMALAHLAVAHDLEKLFARHRRLPFFRAHDDPRTRTLLQAVRGGINAPLTTSLGRLFDAVAALVGLRETVTYEGQAAAELEAALWRDRHGLAPPMCYRFDVDDAGIDPVPLWPQILADLEHRCGTGEIAYRFHAGLAEALLELAERQACRHAGLVERTIVLSGGVLQNAYLLRALRAKFARRGWRVLCHERLPPNDGGLSVGQSAIASASIAGLRSACA
jgi:hydrogenase maturation protein HypF